jgi:hypothetical protein
VRCPFRQSCFRSSRTCMGFANADPLRNGALGGFGPGAGPPLGNTSKVA